MTQARRLPAVRRRTAVRCLPGHRLPGYSHRFFWLALVPCLRRTTRRSGSRSAATSSWAASRTRCAGLAYCRAVLSCSYAIQTGCCNMCYARLHGGLHGAGVLAAPVCCAAPHACLPLLRREGRTHACGADGMHHHHPAFGSGWLIGIICVCAGQPHCAGHLAPSLLATHRPENSTKTLRSAPFKPSHRTTASPWPRCCASPPPPARCAAA